MMRASCPLLAVGSLAWKTQGPCPDPTDVRCRTGTPEKEAELCKLDGLLGNSVALPNYHSVRARFAQARRLFGHER